MLLGVVSGIFPQFGVFFKVSWVRVRALTEIYSKKRFCAKIENLIRLSQIGSNSSVYVAALLM